ncbi:MAG: hypothetical protein H7Z17_01740, partial [Fuerstia sp.]|nr:hypothetical protein [Fuerstiella sp.]
MLRFVYVALTACIALSSAVSAQNPVPTCGALQLSVTSKSDRTFLGLKGCYNCHTNGLPKDGFGDRFGI